jgi:lipid-A-disaccharide synthase
MRIVLLAVEPSADLHAAALIKSIKEINPEIIFEGLGGTHMQAEGLQVWEDMTKDSEMGVSSLSSVFKWLKRIKTTRQKILANLPDMVITIDAPDFNMRVVKGLKGLTKTVQYVAPQAWVWREKRKFQVGELFDHVMCIWPFEVDFFKGHGADITWVGVPSLDHLHRDLEKERISDTPEGKRLVCMLPGSRTKEILLNLDLFIDSAKILLKKYKDLHFIVPKVPHLDMSLFKRCEELGDSLTLQEGGALACMNASEICMAVNGTVTFESMFLSKPHVMTYATTKFQELVYKPLMKTKYYNMTNILMQEEIIPELLLKRRTVKNMVNEMSALLEGPAAEKQKRAFKELHKKLGGAGVSNRAAKVVMEVLNGQS